MAQVDNEIVAGKTETGRASHCNDCWVRKEASLNPTSGDAQRLTSATHYLTSW